MTDKDKKTKSKKQLASELALNKDIEDYEFSQKQHIEDKLHQKTTYGYLSTTPEDGLGQRLQLARESKKLTQGQLSDITKEVDAENGGISRAVLSLYEVGKNRPSPREIRILCEVLRISPNYLIYGDEDPFGDFLNRHRWGGFSESEPEFYALLNFAFFSLYKHQKIDVMNIIMSLLQGWDKDWFNDKTNEANEQFLTLAAELKVLLDKKSTLKK